MLASIFDLDMFDAIAQIAVINLALSGDNALVIALAVRDLPAEQQRRAAFWGGAGAIALRLLATVLVALLLRVPALELGGGLVLLWITARFLQGSGETREVRPSGSMRDAIASIVVADLMLSLDNMLAIGGASEGNLAYLLIGLLISIAVIVGFSTLIARFMATYHWLVYLAAGVMAWTACTMILGDDWLLRWWGPSSGQQLSASIVLRAAVGLAGLWLVLRGRRRTPIEHLDESRVA